MLLGHQGGVADIAEPAGDTDARAGVLGVDLGAQLEHEVNEGVGAVDAVGGQGLVIETVNRERANVGAVAVGEGIDACHLGLLLAVNWWVFGVSCHYQYSTK